MSARQRREDKNKNIAQQLQEFANDSVNFFNKCAKPDRNGMQIYSILPNLLRIHENFVSMRNGIFSYWVYRIHNQASVYSNQQHHLGSLRHKRISLPLISQL